ncbi:MAG: hypothetical protein ABEJ61_10125 [Haloferacaceae archaeon]
MTEDDTDDPDGADATDAGTADSERVRRLEEMEKRLERKERELDDREATLDEREQEALDRREEAVDLREELDDREATLDERRAALDDRETALDERERELDRREETLSAYVGDQLSELEASIADTVRAEVTEAVETHDGGRSRFGAIGGLLLALVGMVLVVAGVANGFGTVSGDVPQLFANTAANYGTTAVLVFCGLAANLAAAAGRV